MLVKIISKFNCQSFPLDNTAIEVSQEVLDNIGKSYCFDVENNKVIPYDNTEDLRIAKENELRAKRKPLLEAFDLWEKAVLRGREEDSTEVMDWYRSLLDLDEIAFENIPKEIKYYL